LLAEMGEPPGWHEGLRLGLVLGPSLARRAEPEQGRKGVVWSGLRVVVLAKWAVEAQEADVFFEKAAEQQDWAQGLSLRVAKQLFRVKRGESEAQVKLGLRAEARREVEEEQEVGLSMVEAQPEAVLSQNPEAERVIPVPRQKHLGSVPLLMIPFRSRRSSQTSSKGQKFY